MNPCTAEAVTENAVPGTKPVSWQVLVVGDGCGGPLHSCEKQVPAGLVGHSSSLYWAQPPAGARAGGVTMRLIEVKLAVVLSADKLGALQQGGGQRRNVLDSAVNGLQCAVATAMRSTAWARHLMQHRRSTHNPHSRPIFCGKLDHL